MGPGCRTATLNDKGFNVRDPLASGGGVKVKGISAATKQEVSTYVDARFYVRNKIGRRIYELWLFDASYIRLGEVSIGYIPDKSLISKTPFKTAKLSLIARDPA